MGDVTTPTGEGGFSAPLPIDPGPAGMPPDGVAERRGSMASITRRAEARAVLRERRLGTRLERCLDGVGFVLHHRVVDYSSPPVDHLVVGPMGVWSIRASHVRGRARCDADAARVVVGSGDQPPVVELDGFDDPNLPAIERLLAAIGYDWVPVRRALCLTKASLRRDRRVGEVLVTTPRRLCGELLGRGQLAPDDVRTVASALHTRFPPVSGHDTR